MKLMINSEKLAGIAEELARDVKGLCCEASVNIGSINGRIYRISVIKPDDDDEELNPKFECVTAAKKGGAV